MPKVKICGITNLKDARAAVEAGADVLGFIFYPPSPRYVSPHTVRDIVVMFKGAGTRNYATRHTPHALPTFVGVFVNAPAAEVEQTLNFCRLDAAQLHGEEPPEVVAHFQGRAYKALRPKSLEEAEEAINNYQLAITNHHLPQLPAFLLDAYHPGLYGGTGRVTDWTMAAAVARKHSMMLAGSLTPENVAGAVRVVNPWGVDVSSGVELEKGKKDHKKIKAFVEAVRKAQPLN